MCIRDRAEELLAQARAQAEKEKGELIARGRRSAEERKARLISAAQMEGRKMSLAAKQEVLDEAFRQALEEMCSLPEEQYIQLLARLAVQASSTGREQLIFSPKDRTRIGKAVVMAANDALVKQVAPELPDAITDSKVGAFLGKEMCIRDSSPSPESRPGPAPGRPAEDLRWRPAPPWPGAPPGGTPRPSPEGHPEGNPPAAAGDRTARPGRADAPRPAPWPGP